MPPSLVTKVSPSSPLTATQSSAVAQDTDCRPLGSTTTGPDQLTPASAVEKAFPFVSTATQALEPAAHDTATKLTESSDVPSSMGGWATVQEAPPSSVVTTLPL